MGPTSVPPGQLREVCAKVPGYSAAPEWRFGGGEMVFEAHLCCVSHSTSSIPRCVDSMLRTPMLIGNACIEEARL